jgi:site-specific DNA-cytosine methylase
LRVSVRDLIKIGDASRVFGVSEQTLRNWDKTGKLRAYRNPINGYRLYKTGDLHALLKDFDAAVLELTSSNVAQLPLSLPSTLGRRTAAGDSRDQLQPCHWSLSVALDPKHRPQHWSAPSSTVRRDWRKYPQEAHVIDETSSRYRRLTPDEISRLQGIDPSVFDGLDLTDRERIACVGDAVPPPLAAAVYSSIVESVDLRSRTSIEVCAGIGGLASGAHASGLEHLALIEKSQICGRVLKNDRRWPSESLHIKDARRFPFKKFRGSVGVFSGGPPCQPWSRSGLRLGSSDERDLLGALPEIIADLRPEVVLFENVPGLTGPENSGYLQWLMERYRRPARDLYYGVLIGKFNAADFGVAQVRQRIFILGIKDGTARDASLCLDRIAAKRTHRDPAISDADRRPWRRIGDVLSDRADPKAWRRWIGSYASEAA